jgi:hypothetical protein
MTFVHDERLSKMLLDLIEKFKGFLSNNISITVFNRFASIFKHEFKKQFNPVQNNFLLEKI